MSTPFNARRYVFAYPAAVEVLLAVVAERHPTVRGVARRLNKAPSSVYPQLIRLRALGLVEWQIGKRGTLRATVAAVPFTAEPVAS